MGDVRFPFPSKADSFKILERDPCFGKIPKGSVQTVFDDAWNVGVNEGNRFLEDSSLEHLDMTSVLENEGFSVITENKDYVIGTQRYFCEYLPKSKHVKVYRDSVNLWAEMQGLDYETAKNVILAHEYFHYLENTKIGWVSRHYMVPMLKIGRHSIGSTGVPALSEIAANAFANTLFTALGTKSEILEEN